MNNLNSENSETMPADSETGNDGIHGGNGPEGAVENPPHIDEVNTVESVDPEPQPEEVFTEGQQKKLATLEGDERTAYIARIRANRLKPATDQP